MGKMESNRTIGRKNFIHLMMVQAAGAFLLGFPIQSGATKSTPLYLPQSDLPPFVQSVCQRIPPVQINEAGFGVMLSQDGISAHPLPLAQTQWNKERSNSFERLFKDVPWGIVLHWFGTTFDNGAESIESYMRGFDGMRMVNGYETRTSAHFLVGDKLIAEGKDLNAIGIVQTQIPDRDGMPFVASHLFDLDYEAHRNREQYFVRAWYQLGYEQPGIHSILTEFFDGPRIDPNYRTIAVELTGANFDAPGGMPAEQQIANAVALVSALMKRYNISIFNLLGHHEIELRKSDPGKVFLQVIRALVGIFALVSKDAQLQHLVFGPFDLGQFNPWQAVYQYFTFLRNYLVLVGYPDQVFDWEVKISYWKILDFISKNFLRTSDSYRIRCFDRTMLPIKNEIALKKDRYLKPENHTGVDLYLKENDRPFANTKSIDVFLPMDGECVDLRRTAVCGHGQTIIFRHYQPDGASVLTIFSNLTKVADLGIGEFYSCGRRIGEFDSGGPMGEGYLHFGVAYGATWDSLLKNQPVLPGQVTADWVSRRFMDPMDYLYRWKSLSFTY